MTADPRKLLTRVKAAKAPDRELDARVWQVLFPDHEVLFDAGDIQTARPGSYGRLSDFPMEGWTDWDGIALHVGASRITASVDDAMLLAERLFGPDEGGFVLYSALDELIAVSKRQPRTDEIARAMTARVLATVIEGAGHER